MAEQRAAAAEQEGDDLPRGVGGIDEREREQGAAQGPDDAVNRVPDRIDPGDLVGKELGERADRRDAQHPRVGEDLQRREMFGERQPAETHRDAGRQYGEVEPPAGEEAEAAGDAQNLDDSQCPAPVPDRAIARHLAPVRARPQCRGEMPR